VIQISLDMRDFERATQAMGAALDQVPFALSQALNDAAKTARAEIVDTVWPRSVTVRNRAFMGWMMRTDFANKNNLKVRLYNREPREFLPRQAEGGTKRPHRGRQLAIPGTIVKRSMTSRGVPPGLRPKDLPNSFRRKNAIFQRVGKSGLRLMYVLESQASVRKSFPAYETWDHVMRSEVMRAFGPRMQRAMRTRR
jgi:hypothetical protein